MNWTALSLSVTKVLDWPLDWLSFTVGRPTNMASNRATLPAGVEMTFIGHINPN